MAEDVRTALKRVVAIDPEIMHGTPCFAGTRVPVQTLIDHLESGATVEDFLAGFPTVTRDQVIAFLDLATEQLLACASS